MKILMGVLALAIVLCGCGAEETFETVADEMVLTVMAQPRSIAVELPGEAALPVVENDNGRIYLCEDYEIVLQTLEGGDVSATMETVSGREKEKLTVMETCADGISRYEFVWAAAGEEGDRLGRGVILDDGNFHYTLCVLRNADSVRSQTNWNQVFSSFSLV